jgi:uncharacterized protein YaaR (DUF327 family)
MRINPDLRSFGKNIRVGESANTRQIEQKNFQDFMQDNQDKQSSEQLAERIKQIQQQGDRLAKSMTVRNLRLYKQMIKQFLEDTVKRGVGLKEVHGLDRRGRGKVHKLLDEIDGQLLQMADELLDTEQGRVTLLQCVGEIRGMLLNLRF